jgi:heme/copper-type cytochrome/quinol oxidase subunit 4
MDFQTMMGVLSAALGLLGSAVYYYALFKHKLKPHVFSWVIWAVLTGIAFAAQVTENAGPGAWVTGIMALSCASVAILAIFIGEKNIARSDWWTFLAALAAIPLWLITDNALYAVVIVTIVDALGFYPTFRKSWHKPDEESATSFALHSIKFVPSLWAMHNFNWTTTMYPISLIIMNGAFVVMVLWRRHQLRGQSNIESP